MKVNKKFVEEVANGKYDYYDTHGEMKCAAQRILREKVVSKFSTYCFRTFGGEIPDNVMDIFDAFVDFKKGKIMNKEQLLAKLLAKREQLKQEQEKFDDRNRLPRKLLFTTLRNQTRIWRKIAAIDYAKSLIEGVHVRDIDCFQMVNDLLPDTLAEYKDSLLRKADSIFLNERIEVIREVMCRSLPICKKQVMEYI